MHSPLMHGFSTLLLPMGNTWGTLENYPHSETLAKRQCHEKKSGETVLD